MKLILFSTRGMSLAKWDEVGMFGREIALYRKLQERGVDVAIVSYGAASEKKYIDRIPGIEVLYNRWHLPRILYEYLVPILHSRALSSSELFKSNQTNGADIMKRAARYWKTPYIARCGYMFSRHVEKQWGKSSLVTRRARAMEEKVFSSASKIVVTADFMKLDVLERLPHVEGKVNVIPNYVETDRFMPMKDVEQDIDILYVGRLVEQKNLFNFMEAISTLDYKVLMIGAGNQYGKLDRKYGDLDGRLSRMDKVPNSELQNYYARAKVYVLPSNYEGHPKTLIEAMSCGCAALGTDAPGIREVISHNETGLLCDLDAISIREGIVTLMNDADLRSNLGHGAREFILGNYSLEIIVEQELRLYHEILDSA